MAFFLLIISLFFSNQAYAALATCDAKSCVFPLRDDNIKSFNPNFRSLRKLVVLKELREFVRSRTKSEHIQQARLIIGELLPMYDPNDKAATPLRELNSKLEAYAGGESIEGLMKFIDKEKTETQKVANTFLREQCGGISSAEIDVTVVQEEKLKCKVSCLDNKQMNVLVFIEDFNFFPTSTQTAPKACVTEEEYVTQVALLDDCDKMKLPLGDFALGLTTDSIRATSGGPSPFGQLPDNFLPPPAAPPTAPAPLREEKAPTQQAEAPAPKAKTDKDIETEIDRATSINEDYEKIMKYLFDSNPFPPTDSSRINLFKRALAKGFEIHDNNFRGLLMNFALSEEVTAQVRQKRRQLLIDLYKQMNSSPSISGDVKRRFRRALTAKGLGMGLGVEEKDL